MQKILLVFLSRFSSLYSPFSDCDDCAARPRRNCPLRVIVDLVQLNVAVTDSKGNYVTGSSPRGLQHHRGRISEKIANFEEGNGPTRTLG